MTLLPEAELLRKELEKEVVGQRIKEVTVRSGGVPDGCGKARSQASSPGSEGDAGDTAGGGLHGLVAALEGQQIEAVIRQGTNLALRLKGGTALVVQSGSGTLTRQPPPGDDQRGQPPGSPWGSDLPDGHVEIVLVLEGGGALYCQDVERNGAVRLVPADELDQSPEFASIGIDPFTNAPRWLEFSRQLVIRNCRLRALLADDTFVVGLGDVYSDEILWAAGLSGMRSSAGLSAQEVRRLYRAIQEVLHEAVKQVRGATDSGDDDPFEDPLARQHFKAFGRADQPCARCRQKIVRKQIDNPPVVSYFCPNCQT